MPRASRFVLVLVAGLGVLTFVAYGGLTRVTRDWFERDLELRARLAVHSARGSLSRSWFPSSERLAETLTDITYDERIMGAAACSEDGTLLAATDRFPSELSCRSVLARMRAESPGARSWTMSSDLASGRVGVSATTVSAPGGAHGVVLLVHDLSYLGRREATTRRLLLVAFFVLAVCASLVTVIAARLAFRRWSIDLKEALSGGASREFQPLVRDVRDLVEGLVQERAAEIRGGPWSPARLRSTLTRYLHGERVVVLANREPYIHERAEDGSIRVLHPASGLVTALEPILRACSGVWVAHGAGSADREASDARGRVRMPPGEESYVVRRVWLSEAEEEGYYYGFSNEGLWPMCHVADARPTFRASDFEQYVAVNRKFAETVVEETDTDDPIVLVQDYHFALAPRMIRERLPRATIITFWHVPWPSAERVGICPWRDELISGLLGSSIVGFHTQQHCNNFIESVDAFMESRIDREAQAIVQKRRRTLVRPYPISIEWPVRWLEGLPAVDECRAAVRRELGLPEDAFLGVGVDRLDYTKGIEERLLAVDGLLERHPELRGRFTFVQLAAPSRTKIARYRDLNLRVERLAAEINERWAQGACPAIVLLRAHHEPPAVFRYFRAADFCYVSSLHDGMNLVAKEFVAAREDERGVLVLSQFTGASRELTEALVVNPYDVAQAAEALATALRMPLAEQRERMRSMRRLIAEFNVYRWAGRMLVDAAELRRRERIAGSLVPVRKEVFVR